MTETSLIGTLDPRARRLLRLSQLLTWLRLLPTPERFLTRPPHKRVGPPLPAWITGPLPAEIQIEDIGIDTPAGRLTLRLYGPDSAEVLPGLLYLHGGGWVGGGARTTDSICTQLAAQAGVRVVSVDYRLSPECPFPGPLDDAAAGLRWTFEHAEQLRINPASLAVAGDSAGGNLAAALALKTRDEDLPALLFQVLIYPVLDGTLSTSSMQSYAGLSLTRKDMATYYNAYAGAHDRTLPLLSPLHVGSAAGLAPAMVVTAGFDCLMDEGRLYVEKLLADGVQAVLMHFPDAPHGFFSLGGLCRQTAPALTAVSNALQNALRPTISP